MLKLAQVPDQSDAADAGASKAARVPRARHVYYAFLSYSHQDEAIAEWLHEQLEQFKVPHYLVGRLTENGAVPNRLAPVFRDRHELAAAGDLGIEIQTALASSRFLIVMCSPAAAQSHWTNAEIDAFKRSHPEGCVLAAIVDGEPFASERRGKEQEECFPPALRCKYDRRGRPTRKRAEPLAADLRESGDGRRIGLLKLVAGMLSVGLDELVQREQTRRHRRLAWIAAASLAGMAVTSGLAVTAVQSRDSARDQRREAEGLVAFMLGDLRGKLEPIGRLDALDGVGSRVLAYYSKQDAGDLSDAALLQRSQALNLMAEVAYARGDLNAAEKLYEQALAGTAEAIDRNSSDPQRLFDHAQNVFWIADIQRQRGLTRQAERGMREYKRLADQMVALAPDNMKWRMEQQNAYANLGVLLYEQRRFPEATNQFTEAVRNMEALATANPNNNDYRKSLTESQAWLADSEKSEGRLDESTALRERHIALLRDLLQRTGDIEYRQKLVPSERYLGELYWYRGRLPEAFEHYSKAVENADMLIAREPDNSRWKYFASRARLDRARALVSSGHPDQARTDTEAACDVSGRLVAIDSNVQRWRGNLRDCFYLRAQLALGGGQRDPALRYAARAVDVGRTVKSTDPVEDRYALAAAWRLVGDLRKASGQTREATAAWQAGLSIVPAGVAEKPTEMAVHATLLQRLGRDAEARQRVNRLTAINYRNPEFRSAT